MFVDLYRIHEKIVLLHFWFLRLAKTFAKSALIQIWAASSLIILWTNRRCCKCSISNIILSRNIQSRAFGGGSTSFTCCWWDFYIYGSPAGHALGIWTLCFTPRFRHLWSNVSFISSIEKNCFAFTFLRNHMFMRHQIIVTVDIDASCTNITSIQTWMTINNYWFRTDYWLSRSKKSIHFISRVHIWITQLREHNQSRKFGIVAYHNFDVLYHNKIGKSSRYLYKTSCCGILHSK